MIFYKNLKSLCFQLYLMFRYETYDETVNVLNVLGYNGYRVVGMGTNMANRYSVTNTMSKQFWFLFMLTLIIFLSTFFQNRMMILKCICNIKNTTFLQEFVFQSMQNQNHLKTISKSPQFPCLWLPCRRTLKFFDFF